MTKIAVKGPAAGLGSVTLEAPETDNELNLKLPSNSTKLIGDEGGDFQSMPSVGGEPIVESGSNSDGNWWRAADGAQDCYFDLDESRNSAGNNGTGFSWPMPFAPQGGIAPSYGYDVVVSSTGVTSYPDNVITTVGSITTAGGISHVYSSTSTARRVLVRATGRWK